MPSPVVPLQQVTLREVVWRAVYQQQVQVVQLVVVFQQQVQVVQLLAVFQQQVLLRWGLAAHLR